MPDSTLIFFCSLPKFHENDNKDETKIHKSIGRKSRGGSKTKFWNLKTNQLVVNAKRMKKGSSKASSEASKAVTHPFCTARPLKGPRPGGTRCLWK